MDVGKTEKTRLGLFVLGTLGLFLLILFFMVGKRLLTRTETYYTRIRESVGGLEPGAPVKQNGVDIGNVTGIATDPRDITQAEVRFRVRKGTPMKKDMVASLGSFGITGLKYIEVTGGTYASEDLPPGGELPSGLSTLGKLTQRADSIARKVDLILGNVAQITDEENRRQIEGLMRSADNLGRSLDTLFREVNRIQPARRLERMLADFEATADEVRQKVEKTEVEETVQEFRQAARGLTEVAQKVDITVLKVQDDLSQSVQNLKETMKNMNTFSRQIKENPAVLLRGEDKRERRR